MTLRGLPLAAKIGEGMEKNVSGILASLEEEEAKMDEEEKEKENEYKVVVAEDELNKMAWEAAQEIEELRYIRAVY